MKKPTKTVLSLLGIGILIFLTIELMSGWKEYSSNKAYEEAQREKLVRMGDAQRKLAQSLATCSADSLRSKHLAEFITYEIMPLGLAWQLANSSKLNDLKQQRFRQSLETNAAQRLNLHFQLYLDSSTREVQAGKVHEYIQKLRNGEVTKPVQIPSLSVYKTLSAANFRDKEPADIEIGAKDVDWPDFVILAKRCKATPHDLRVLAGKDSSGSSHTPESGMEYVDYSNSDYIQMKREFWRIFSETQQFKDALLEIKSSNADIVRKIIEENEPVIRRQELEKSKAESMLFK